MRKERARFDFEAEWPRVRGELEALLTRRRVPQRLREDLIQETAARLWKLRERVDPRRGAGALATTIALNLLRDHVRREQRVVTGADLHALPARHDIANEVVARDEWRLIRSALAKLHPAHRAVLLAELEDPIEGSVTSAAVRMMKMRARKRLRGLVDELSRAKAGSSVAAQRAWENLRTRFGSGPTRGESFAQLAGATVVMVTVAMSSLTPSGEAITLGPRPADRGTRGLGGDVPSAAFVSSDDTDVGSIPSRGFHEDGAAPASAKKRRKHRPWLHVGPIMFSSDGSLTPGTLTVEAQKVPVLKSRVDVPDIEPPCRVLGLLDTCREKKNER